MTPELDFAELAAPGLRELSPYVPGKPMEALEREYGISDSVKLASNENPLGPPAAAVEAARASLAELERYPDGEGYALKRRLAEHLGVAAEQITIGNGSNELLVMLAESFLEPGREAIYDQHAFIIYPLATRATGATGRVAKSLPADHAQQPLGHDATAFAANLGPRSRLLFIANPNNPTGSWITMHELRGLLEQVPRDVIVVLDEAYAEYVTDPAYPDGLTLLAEFPNLVVTRTFSKIYALAGLRLGYAVSHPAMAELLNRIRQPFNTSSVAQAAAIAALGDHDHVRRSRELNATGRVQLAQGLKSLGLRPLPSQGNFLLVEVGSDAQACYDALLRAGIIVRPVANYGLSDYLRVTVGLPEHNERLLAALADWRGTATTA
jgi:histidinol-phosphate aminotransferase